MSPPSEIDPGVEVSIAPHNHLDTGMDPEQTYRARPRKQQLIGTTDLTYTPRGENTAFKGRTPGQILTGGSPFRSMPIMNRSDPLYTQRYIADIIEYHCERVQTKEVEQGYIWEIS